MKKTNPEKKANPKKEVNPNKKVSPDIPWDEIFKHLEAWKKEMTSAGQEVPVVNEIADIYLADLATKTQENTPWAVLVSTILSLRTKDEVTRITSKALLKKAPNPKKLISLGETEAARLAYPAGFYRTKAKQLIKIAAILIEKYDSQVPSDLDALLALPGVGRKTANLVLNEAFDMDAICVDIHVHRICNRLGVLQTKEPFDTEMALREILPRKYWKRINLLLVHYGQRLCRPVSPFCSCCIIRSYCKAVGVTKSR
jgi:endonuclease-3